MMGPVCESQMASCAAPLETTLSAHIFDFADDQHAIAQHPAKYHVLLVQPVCLGARDKELAAIGVLAAVGLRIKKRRLTRSLEL